MAEDYPPAPTGPQTSATSTARILRSTTLPSTSSTPSSTQLSKEPSGEEVESVGSSGLMSDSGVSSEQPAAKKVRPSPIVWGQPSESCECMVVFYGRVRLFVLIKQHSEILGS